MSCGPSGPPCRAGLKACTTSQTRAGSKVCTTSWRLGQTCCRCFLPACFCWDIRERADVVRTFRSAVSGRPEGLHYVSDSGRLEGLHDVLETRADLLSVLSAGLLLLGHSRACRCRADLQVRRVGQA